MILRRLGNKSRIAGEIIKHFPKHEVYIEPFFGAGGMFFNKPRAKYNLLNDIDNNVFNLFQVLMNRKNELKEYLELVPYHECFWDYAKTAMPKNEIEKAVFFLVLSNWGYLGKPDTLKFELGNKRENLLKNVETTYESLCKSENQFSNCDFREVLSKISFRQKEKDKERTFIYADPPYVGTTDNYSDSFTQSDHIDLVDMLIDSKIRFAISEFDNEFVIENAKSKGLNIIEIGERKTLNNRNTEILITNYQEQQIRMF